MIAWTSAESCIVATALTRSDIDASTMAWISAESLMSLCRPAIDVSTIVCMPEESSSSSCCTCVSKLP